MKTNKNDLFTRNYVQAALEIVPERNHLVEEIEIKETTEMFVPSPSPLFLKTFLYK
jgi:hypothetical protein